MKWETLFTEDRLGSKNRNSATESRGHFIRDYDKVIFSPQFRRLQNKTQVFPLPANIFVHNRLTHSLEVASVGRSMARKVGEELFKRYQITWDRKTQDFYKFELSDVIQTACLAHDIGNPPFGHFGEEAIRDFFTDFFADQNHGLSEEQLADFIRFEGNANAFRILSNLYLSQGLKLTYTTLASIIKYPVSSIKGFNKSILSKKKSGYFISDKLAFVKTMVKLEIPKIDDHSFSRHPFVFLVEAADDICYRIIDLEDALRLKIVPYLELEGLLLPFFENHPWREFIQEQLDKTQDSNQKIALLRAMLINKLSEDCAQIFVNKADALLQGKVEHSLIDLLDPHEVDLLKKIDAYSVKNIYNSELAIERELAGYTVIKGLLSVFVNARISPDKPRSKKLLKLLPYPLESDIYTDLMCILDFITDMTDEQALMLFKKINGI